MVMDTGAPAPAPTPTTSLQNQVSAATRHLVTAGGTAVTILGALALLPADKVADAVTGLQMLGDHLQLVFGDLSKLWLILGPVLIGFAVKGATFAASLKGQLKSITSNPAVKVEGTIVTTPSVAAAVPSDKVVPS